MTDFYLLYIPFWLNLYQKRIIIINYILRLYIPFWLNLYDDAGGRGRRPERLYIPFWLNLYIFQVRSDLYMSVFTFHSG